MGGTMLPQAKRRLKARPRKSYSVEKSYDHSSCAFYHAKTNMQGQSG